MRSMTRRQLLQTAGAAALALTSLNGPAAASPGPAAAKGGLIVHEWGTFLSVQGSDGVTLGGMVASEEVLPPFVESRNITSWQRTLFLSKMETPVTYFYTDRPRVVDVRVGMPAGVLTHWYPMVRRYGPALSAGPDAPPGQSFLDWGRVHLLPTSRTYRSAVVEMKEGRVVSGLVSHETADQVELIQPDGSAVTVAKRDIDSQQSGPAMLPVLWRVKHDDTWKFARATDSALVRVPSRNLKDWSEHDYEKFLFYRGLGTFDTPLEVRSSGPDGDSLELTLRNRGPEPLRGLFAIRVENNTIRFGALADLPPGATRGVAIAALLEQPLPLHRGVPQAKAAVADVLMRAGLYRREAEAMVNSWEKSYFHTDGLRILHLLPRDLVDTLIPITIKPAPDELVRVMVGRTEVLTPETERQIEKWLGELGSNDFRTREEATAALGRLGRLAEPALRRVAALTGDLEVRKRAERLIEAAATKE